MIDFELTPQQAQVKEMVHQFAKHVVRPISLQADKDHRIPWPTGRTSAANGQCLCRHHHRAKHTVFTVLPDPDGSYLWITRGGWRFHRQPQGF